MLRYIDSTKMGRSFLGWLDSHFHFSFAEYHNPDNIQFGALRVVNDDLIEPGTGFDTHPHRDMEIITYVVDGELTHADSMGNKHALTRGQVQYMSAGTGVQHSEHNFGNERLRLLQIWILPDKKGHTPNYGEYRFKMDERENTWLPIVTSAEHPNGKAPIQIHQDMNVYATLLTNKDSIDFPVGKGRQAYLIMIEGSADINGIKLNMRDALEITEETVTIKPEGSAHVLVLEMAKA